MHFSTSIENQQILAVKDLILLRTFLTETRMDGSLDKSFEYSSLEMVSVESQSRDTRVKEQWDYWQNIQHRITEHSSLHQTAFSSCQPQGLMLWIWCTVDFCYVFFLLHWSETKIQFLVHSSEDRGLKTQLLH